MTAGPGGSSDLCQTPSRHAPPHELDGAMPFKRENCGYFSEATFTVQRRNDNYTVESSTMGARVGLTGRMRACVVAVAWLWAAGAAQAQPPANLQAPSFLQLVTTLEGFGQTGHFDTGNPNTTNSFGVRGGGFSVGTRLGGHPMIGP